MGTTGLGAAGLLLSGDSALGANGDIRIAVAGCGRKSGQHIQIFNSLPGVRVTALCDPDPDCLNRGLSALKRTGRVASGYQDPRRLLEKEPFDALVIVTPNHWHALLTIWACQAGKDVYVEKPVCHCPWEGPRMIEAAARYKRIVQAGTQTRSDTGVVQALPYIREGNLGKVLWVHSLWFQYRTGIGKQPPRMPPHDWYDIWCGPSPKVPISRNHLHYDWHWVWRTGNGAIGNLGIHEVDMGRMFAGHKGLPPRVISVGGRFGWHDAGETPNTQLTLFDYDEIPVLLENRCLPMKAGMRTADAYRQVRMNSVIQCEKGHMTASRGGAVAYDSDGKRIRRFPGDGGGRHQGNFIEAMRSRKQSDLAAPLHEGVISTELALFGAISYRVGQPASVAEIKQALGKNNQAVETVGRIETHLKANNIDLDKTPMIRGAWLTLEKDGQKVTAAEGGDAADANALIKDNYRQGFEIPESI